MKALLSTRATLLATGYGGSTVFATAPGLRMPAAPAPVVAKTAIRPLTMADLSRGFLESLAALKATDLTPEEAESVLAEIAQNPNHHILVAVDGDRVVAAATLLVEPKFIHRGGRAGHIEDVAVHADRQGEGIGRQLIDACLALAKAEGCYKTILDCSSEVAGFYAGMGFYHFAHAMRVDHRVAAE